MNALVLIADDSPEILDSHGEILRQAGYRVCTACNGEEAIGTAIRRRPDVIIMDLDMPILDGWEATRRIRADLRTHHIPVIAYTSYGLRRYVDRSFEAGCSAFIDKPCEGRVLVAEIERALATSAARTHSGVVVDAVNDIASGPALQPPPSPPADRRQH
jgi:two-component system cell cycle response regulator DivK